MRIYLTGFMGSGKTTVGRALARQLNLPFIDLDQQIEMTIGKSILEIFQQFGEPEFRKFETKVLQSIQLEAGVIATGGGCFIHHADWMLENGKVIYLRVPFEILTQRVGADASRPLWKNAKMLFAEREEFYRKAHFEVDAEEDPETVAARIVSLLAI